MPPFLVPHQEVSVKTNSMVDEGVAPLVIALSKFPQLLTLDSCEGGYDGQHDRDAYVYFTISGDEPGRVEVFTGKLARALYEDVPHASWSIMVEWFLGSDQAVAEIRVPKHHIKELADKIITVASVAEALGLV